MKTLYLPPLESRSQLSLRLGSEQDQTIVYRITGVTL
ncbi:hypothetical protein BV323_00980 [Pseudomonas syringae pv. actinidiae]|nr:hypothetical protein BV320_00981 [Pseudomonas syringae pv. actinidiae]OSR57187.1 hypothetical protein BV323_00980 [Pseudomonas syringae pv. actinidiae]OSR60684.1 hypothetical protein BV324_00980 [Pseudomonas syringae pv. actinidiae]